MTKFKALKYEMLEHPPNSPDLAPSGYYLFQNLKQFLESVFLSNEEAIAAADGHFIELPERMS